MKLEEAERRMLKKLVKNEIQQYHNGKIKLGKVPLSVLYGLESKLKEKG